MVNVTKEYLKQISYMQIKQLGLDNNDSRMQTND